MSKKIHPKTPELSYTKKIQKTHIKDRVVIKQGLEGGRCWTGLGKEN